MYNVQHCNGNLLCCNYTERILLTTVINCVATASNVYEKYCANQCNTATAIYCAAT